jgi:hypothetical protein
VDLILDVIVGSHKVCWTAIDPFALDTNTTITTATTTTGMDLKSLSRNRIHAYACNGTRQLHCHQVHGGFQLGQVGRR